MTHATWTGTATALMLAGPVLGGITSRDSVTATSGIRNMLISSSIALLLAACGPLWMAWLGPIGYSLAAMEWGSPDGIATEAWAIIIEPAVTPAQLALAAAFSVLAWAMLVVRALRAAGLGMLDVLRRRVLAPH